MNEFRDAYGKHTTPEAEYQNGYQDGYVAGKEDCAAEIAGLREALERLIAACDAGRRFERGSGGMTIEAQLARTVINGVRASAVEDARDALVKQGDKR